MKKCIEPGCDNFQFGGGYCQYHSYRRRMQGGDQFKKKKPIKKRTLKREKDERHYSVLAKEFFENAVNNKTNHCFICGELVINYEGTHHVYGRREGALLDFDKIVLVHNECHLMVHNCSVDILEKQTWYNDFLKRLKDRFPEAHNKQMDKKFKANPINPQRGLFDDDD